MQTKRIDIRVPVPLLKEIQQYMDEQSIQTRTSAMLELIRKGLKKNEV